MYDRWMALAGVQRSTSAQDVNRSMGGQGSKDERDEVYEDPDSLVGEGPSGSVCFPVGLQKRYLVAQYDYTSFTKDQLTMNKGDRIVALTPEDDGWVFGQNIVDNSKGWFPAGYVIDADAADHALYPTSFGPGSPPSARKGASGGSSGNTLSSPPTSSTNKGGSLGRQTGQDTLSSLASSDKSTQKKPGRRTQSHVRKGKSSTFCFLKIIFVIMLVCVFRWPICLEKLPRLPVALYDKKRAVLCMYKD